MLSSTCDGHTEVIQIKCPWLQVVVQHVNIQGLGRTKEDLLGYEISDVFHAKNLIDVCIYDCNAQQSMIISLSCEE